MTAPVRLRGEVGERRRKQAAIDFEDRRADRRSNPSTAARIDAIVARFKAALAELQQQHREERARDADEIAILRSANAEYRRDRDRMRDVIGKAAAAIERRELARTGEAEAKLASGAGAGECGE